jgi:hypothetical protein
MTDLPVPDSDDDRKSAESLPVDVDVLPALGRVTWAAVRLQHVIRDRLNQIPSQPPELGWAGSLGHAITSFERAAAHVAEPRRTEIRDWCRDVGRPARDLRNGVAHSIAFTTGEQQHALAVRGSIEPLTEDRLNYVVRCLMFAEGSAPPVS